MTEENIGVTLAKKAYQEGAIDLETFERALEDRVGGVIANPRLVPQASWRCKSDPDALEFSRVDS